MEFNQLLAGLISDYPKIIFKSSDHFAWSSQRSEITYAPPSTLTVQQDIRCSNKLLHELSHAILGHSDYRSDAELLKIESAAWSLARKLSKKYQIKFDIAEQNKSLQSYISWASSRSECPQCKKNGLQTASTTFLCPNCSHKWNVGKSRFKRTYRH